MMRHDGIVPGELRNPAPDLQGDELSELIDCIKFALAHDDLVELSGKKPGRHSRFESVKLKYKEKFVARDNITGFFIKAGSRHLANAEYATMNYLSDKLAKCGDAVGVSAVRYAYMFTQQDEWKPSVTVIEPTAGDMLEYLYETHQRGRSLDEGFEQYDEERADMERRLNKVFTEPVRRTLASDLHPGNVFLHRDDTCTIIDQPHPHYARSSLDLLEHIT